MHFILTAYLYIYRILHLIISLLLYPFKKERIQRGQKKDKGEIELDICDNKAITKSKPPLIGVPTWIKFVGLYIKLGSVIGTQRKFRKTFSLLNCGGEISCSQTHGFIKMEQRTNLQ